MRQLLTQSSQGSQQDIWIVLVQDPKRSQVYQASGGENRKRRRHSAQQLEKLHALFAKTQHPSAMQQQTLASEAGLEKKQVRIIRSQAVVMAQI